MSFRSYIFSYKVLIYQALCAEARCFLVRHARWVHLAVASDWLCGRGLSGSCKGCSKVLRVPLGLHNPLLSELVKDLRLEARYQDAFVRQGLTGSLVKR